MCLACSPDSRPGSRTRAARRQLFQRRPSEKVVFPQNAKKNGRMRLHATVQGGGGGLLITILSDGHKVSPYSRLRQFNFFQFSQKGPHFGPEKGPKAPSHDAGWMHTESNHRVGTHLHWKIRIGSAFRPHPTRCRSFPGLELSSMGTTC